MREISHTRQLRHAGFIDPGRAENLLAEPVLHKLDITRYIEEFSAVSDPDQCLLALIRLGENCADQGRYDVLHDLISDLGPRSALFALLGMSSALGDFLISHTGQLDAVLSSFRTDSNTEASEERFGIPPVSLASEREVALRAVGGDPASITPVARLSGAAGVNAMRVTYLTRVCTLAAADLTSTDVLGAMPLVGAAMSDIVGGALDAALAVARAEVPGSERVGLTVIAMGKTGARELNYISDVDVVYVARSLEIDGEEPLPEAEMLAIATKLAAAIGKAVSAPAGEPGLWILDAALRPEGKDGPLVRTLESHVAYYERWAKGWEFQALLKARPIAGDLELGAAYLEALWPLVWTAAGRENFVEDSRAMRRRVEDHVPAREENRQLKLGKGGLRDVEFTVQLLQLVHGRADQTLRVRSTLEALAALRDGGYVARNDALALDHDYRLLRTLEHRIQLQRLRRSHLVPTNTTELRRIARSMHTDGITTEAELEEVWQSTRRQVRGLHQEIYYRPLLPEAARLSADDISLNFDAAIARLAATGYRDPVGALNHIRALTAGVSRTAAIQRQLLPVMIGWFAQGPEPDNGLLTFRVLSEKMGRTSWYMRTLRDGGAAAERLCTILSSSRYLADQIPSLPESVNWLVETGDLLPLTREQLDLELDSLIGRRNGASEIAAAGRYLRRREMLRAGMGQTLRIVNSVDSRAAVSHAADIALDAALQAATLAACQKLETEPLSRYLIVAMGRLGGEEMGYASDADILFVHDPLPDVDPEAAQRLALEIAAQVKALLQELGPQPPLPVDFDLRPEGRQGMLTRTLASYAEYYERWAQTWERQSLLRARPCAGDADLAASFVALIDPYRYPADGLSDSEALEILRIKARVETERMPRGVSPHHHLKLGRGGLSDVEWTAQLIQLKHAGKCAKLRTTSTLGALDAAASAGIISEADAEQLATAWNLASEIRDANFLGTGRSSSSKIDVLPHNLLDLAVVSSLLGHDVSSRHDIEEEYLRASRRSRAVVERVFYGK
ncbi:bifunctional [glutamine synthetase] adenylyltransferase/[glutamine synthetase]-adenylyl-L-tyrosine phosphorylase [Changpingibacter yushuensis]|uniref:bifunctional [glutamine synthetase] adenylyltransferase/[glutamine synthetase]-adenylyl-L-tyrosine phosphorylase n=1 Tax=Changpingibacter yushuensis TaxID=2758440 RepID=UPI0015F4C816|nr:bifunctional [glutamine synthetase] adenylyltransferase/[glutamine synthetase]-adenylyl-L-tyrosine phosphorylase [Changpingibacter yushuensis]